CMVCHGELVRLRPSRRHLTSFYLMVSLGGAVGGLSAAIIAPYLFHSYWEFHLGIWITAALLFVLMMRDKTSWLHERSPALALGVIVADLLVPTLLSDDAILALERGLTRRSTIMWSDPSAIMV